MLIRCARCHAVFSVQDGLTGPVQRAFRVECGRCEAVFDAKPAQVPEAPRIPPVRRTPTPVPLQRPVYGPIARKKPLTRRGAIAIGAAAAAAVAALVGIGLPRAWRGRAR